MPGLAERCRQLTEARADNQWLADGSAVVQQQAIRDHDQAMATSSPGRTAGRRGGKPGGMRGSGSLASSRPVCAA
jgi:hypothetical protein